MEDKKIESLKKCLEYTNSFELPQEYDESSGNYWLKAIVLVKKHNMTENYSIAERNSQGKPIVVRDFGAVSPLSSIEKVYPYVILDKSLVPKFEDIEELKNYLVGNYGEEYRDKINNSSKEQLKQLLFSVVKENQNLIEDKKKDAEKQELLDKKEEEELPHVEEVPTISRKEVENNIKAKRGRKKSK